MNRSVWKQNAKDSIKGRSFACFLPAAVVILITAVVDGLLGYYTYGIIAILGTILLQPLYIGLYGIYLKIIKDKTSQISLGEIFTPYTNINRLGNFILAQVVSAIYIVLGTICLVIPGIIFALRYSILPFVFAENPDMNWRDALKECKKLMKGNVGELFVMWLSFLGWIILSALTICILFVWTLPYMYATFANFYTHLKPYDDANTSGTKITGVEYTDIFNTTETSDKDTDNI